MKLSQFLASGIKSGERVIVTTVEGYEVETTYSGLCSFGIDIIKNPDTVLQAVFRAPTVYFGGALNVPLEKIASVKPLTPTNTYEVEIFILGTSPAITKETVISRGATSKEAEANAIAGSSRQGWGVTGSRLVPESE